MRSRLVATTLLSVATAAVVVMAVTATGIPVNHVSANDGGVWVTDDNPGAGYQGSFGEFNVPISELETHFGVPGHFASSYSLDVRQDGTTVLAIDAGRGEIYPVDVQQGAPDTGAGVAFPLGGQVELGGGTLAVLAPASGRADVWASEVGSGPIASVAGLGARATPLATIVGGTALAVDDAGDVYVASRTELLMLPADQGRLAPGRITRLSPPLRSVELTTVGTTPVILDSVRHEVLFPLSARTTALPAPAATSTPLVLQQSGPSAGSVLLASSSALYQVPLDGAAPSTIATVASGVPAQPVRLDGCGYAAWAGQPGQSVEACPGAAVREEPTAGVDGGTAPLRQPVFRVNNNQILLNDEANGDVWTLADHVPEVLTNQQWDHVLAGGPSKSTTTPKRPPGALQSGPQRDDPRLRNPTLYARAGRESILHVLDDDSDPGGSILSIVGVSRASQPGFSVQVSPDTQTVTVSLAAGLTHPVNFGYEVVDGLGRTASGTVTVVPTTAETAPYQLPGGGGPTRHVVSGGTVSEQVLGNWRDTQSDPISLADASVPTGKGEVTWTGDGLLTYTAPVAPVDEAVTISYHVTDGRSAPVPGDVALTVLGRGSTVAYPPTGAPDAVRIAVGRPTPVLPLANDIFGADPGHPAAKLALAGPLGPEPGLSVSTDMATGQVTLTASQPGAFSLTYKATYGSTTSAATQLLVQASKPSGPPKPPVTTPASVLLHGQFPATVDVLQSDYDPSGGVLTVVGVTADQGYQATVVQGGYLRIVATSAAPPSDQILTYQVTNGVTPPVEGQVTVSWAPALAAMPPVVAATYATVRAGDEVDVPVLSSAGDPDGESVSLLPGGDPSPVGLSPTDLGAGVYRGGLGAASIANGELRYAAPPAADVTTPEAITLSSVVESQSGERTTAQTFVTVEPVDPSQDRAPDPLDVDARVSAGGQVTIPIPTTGVDPDGDTALVTGIGSSPTMGRIVSVQAASITYQAYPSAAGTDTFTYRMEDPYGLTGQATVHVGIIPPSQTQPPVAVDDYVTGSPGEAVDVDILDNDIIAPGTQVTVEPLATTNRTVPAGSALVGSARDVLQVRVPTGAQPTIVTYGITDGASVPSRAQVIVRSQPGYRTPPVATDYFPPPPGPGAKSIRVDVLADDTNPEGSTSGLSIVSAFNPTVAVAGPDLIIPVSAYPRAVPYEIRSGALGATAVGVVNVLGTPAGPHLRPGLVISVPQGGTTTVNIDRYISDAVRSVRLTTDSAVSVSPAAGLSERVVSNTSVQLRGLGGYRGPGTLSLQVTDGTTLSDALASTATFSIPVQVGSSTPVVRCPPTPVTVVEGGPPVDLDLATVCPARSPTGPDAGPLVYTETWAMPAPGVSLGWQGGPGHVLSLEAGSAATGGTTGRIEIGVEGAGPTADSSIPVQVEEAPLASVAPIAIPGVEAGHTASIDLSQYVTSPLARPRIKVLSVVPLRPGLARETQPSPSLVDIEPLSTSQGTLTFSVRVTDAPTQPQRAVTGLITLQVLGLPGRPGALQGEPGSGTVDLSWGAAPDNGAPIDYYVVSTGAQTRRVQGTSYTWSGGLTDGSPTTFTVTAHNQVGLSHESVSATFTPRGVPGAPSGVTATGGDEAATIHWVAPIASGQPITSYTVSVAPSPGTGPTTVAVGSGPTSYVWHGLDNSVGPYTFDVVAHNSVGPGPASAPSNPVYAFGPPPTPRAPVAAGAVSTDQRTTTITVSWPAIVQCDDAQPCARYIVTERRDGQAEPSVTVGGGCSSCSADFGPLTNDGSSYTYTLQAVNAEGEASTVSAASSPPIVAHGLPGAIDNLTATAGDSSIGLQFTLPTANGALISQVDYSVTGGANPLTGDWPVAVPAVTETIPNLVNGTEYTVTVSACTAVGLCGPSATATADPHGVPDAPVATATPTPDGTAIVYTWSGGGGNGRPIANYEVCIDGICTAQGPNPGSETVPYACSPTPHTIHAHVVDSAGQPSRDSLTASATLPCMPPTLTATVSEDSVTFTWAGGTGNGLTIANYELCINADPCIAEGPTAGTAPITYPCGTTITAYVYALYSDGSKSVDSTPAVLVSTPACLSLTTTANGDVITFTWGGGGGGSGAPIANYELCISAAPPAAGVTCTPEGPDPGSVPMTYACGTTVTAYTYVVDSNGELSTKSPPVTASTTACGPPAPILNPVVDGDAITFGLTDAGGAGLTYYLCTSVAACVQVNPPVTNTYACGTTVTAYAYVTDAAGNPSSDSATEMASTAACTTTPPTAPPTTTPLTAAVTEGSHLR